jgi:di/tricarboxylate transporter
MDGGCSVRGARQLILVVIVSTVASTAGAQVPELQRGMRVRVDASQAIGRKIIGTLMSQSGDTLGIASSSRSWHWVQTSEIRRIDVSRGNSSVQGALMGVFIGGIAPALITLAIPKKAARNLELTIAIAGGVLGGAVGFALGTESWKRVYPHRETIPPDRNPVR